MSKRTLHILTATNSDNEYDGLSYAYIEVTEAGLAGLKELSETFRKAHEGTPSLWSGTFAMPPGVSCSMLERLGGEADGYDSPLSFECEDGPVLLAEPLPDDIVSQETDFRLTGADIVMYDPASFYIKDFYKHDRGGVESLEIAIPQLDAWILQLEA